MKNKTLKELTSLDLSNTKNFKKQRLLVEDLVFEVNKAKKEVYTEYLSLLNEKNNYFEMLKCLGIDNKSNLYSPRKVICSQLIGDTCFIYLVTSGSILTR